MKKTCTLLSAFLILNTAWSQQAGFVTPYTDDNSDGFFAPLKTTAVNCLPNTFYGLTSANEIVSLTLNGTSVTNNGVIVPAASSTVNSLAVATDLMNGSSQSFFYSSTPDNVTYHDGTNWQLVLFDPVINHNAGGAGGFLYYQVNGGGYPAMIRRFDGVALNTIYLDSNLNFSVADIGVTDAGNIFFFSGQSSNSLFLHELSPTGVILNTYPFVFNSAAAYGCFVMNNTIYVGIGPTGATPNSLIPITISGGTVTAGTPISMPALNFKDLTGCSGETTGIFSSPAFEPDIILYPNPASEILHIEIAGAALCDLKFMDASGRLVHQETAQKSGAEININNLPPGIYIAEITIRDKKIYKKIHKT